MICQVCNSPDDVHVVLVRMEDPRRPGPVQSWQALCDVHRASLELLAEQFPLFEIQVLPGT